MEHVDFIDELLSDISWEKQKITRHKDIPLSQLKLETNEWKSADNVACVFVDLENSTQLVTGDIQKAMQIFSVYGDSLVDIFDHYQARYIDIQGDGGFALFDGNNSFDEAYHAAVAVNSVFNVYLQLKISMEVRIGVDIGTIIAKKVGKRGKNKEVWLGSPVYTACKLCNLKNMNIGNIRISKNFFYKLPFYYKRYFKNSQMGFYHSKFYLEIDNFFLYRFKSFRRSLP